MLKGKVAAITGAASGIGTAIAELYHDNGAKVALLDLDDAGASALADRLGDPDTARSYAVNVTDSEGVRRVIGDVVSDFGGLDILVNAAGILVETPFLEMSEEVFSQTVDIDLKGVFLTARWGAEAMVRNGGGRIINIASQLGIKGGVNLAHYVAAKAGVIGLTKAMALELAPHNILVNAIAPGPIETPRIGGLSEEWKAEKAKELPLGRFGRSEEVAPTALLLASSPGGDLYVGQTLGPNSGDVMP